MSNATDILASVEAALEALDPAPTVFVGRRWPTSWDATWSALVRLEGVEPGDGHGGVERRTYVVAIVLRVRKRDNHGEDQQPSIVEKALAVRDAFHLGDPADFSAPPTGFHQVVADDPVEVVDDVDEQDRDYIESVVVTRWECFEVF